MNDTSKSYRCKVSLGNTDASLRLGWRRFKVDVVEMSRDSFCVRVPVSISRRVAVGSQSKLFYQDMLWGVQCTHKWMSEKNNVDLEFTTLDELTPLQLPKASFWSRTKGAPAAGQGDTTLPIAMLTAFILVVLVAPAWGGQWGTSDLICSSVSATWSALTGLISGR